jgi:hypothetical protein
MRVASSSVISAPAGAATGVGVSKWTVRESAFVACDGMESLTTLCCGAFSLHAPHAIRVSVAKLEHLRIKRVFLL